MDAIASASISLQNDDYVGNTELVAQWIQEETSGDLFLIKTKEQYPAGYDETIEVGEMQNQEDIHPELASKVENMDSYDVIFLGYPVWNYDIPVAVDSFLESYDLSGKTIVPFCTSGGNDISITINSISKYQPDSTILDGLTIRDSEVLDSKSQVQDWLSNLSY